MPCHWPDACKARGCQRPAEALRVVDGSEPPPGFDPNAQVHERVAQVIRWRGITKLDLPTELVLQGATDADLRCVVVLGYKQDGEEYFASTMADGADVLWLLERLKLRLLQTGIETDAV